MCDFNTTISRKGTCSLKWDRYKDRDMALERINAIPGLSAGRPEATYLLWIDCRDLNLENPARFFEEQGVGLSDGRDFGMGGFVRLNFGTTPELLAKGLARMEKGVAGLS